MFAPKYPDATIAISSRVCSCFFFFFFFFLTNKLSYFPIVFPHDTVAALFSFTIFFKVVSRRSFENVAA